ncbi:ATP synthase subunit I [Desulfothermus okinawensis]
METKKVSDFLDPYIASEPVVRWIVRVQLVLLSVGMVLFFFAHGVVWAGSFLVGGLLVFFNFIVLARILPNLVVSKDSRASIFSLLFSFYSRLIFTGIVLLVCIVFLRMPIYPLIVGLSTIIVGIIFWIVRYIFTTKHKEAEGYVRSSSSRIAS